MLGEPTYQPLAEFPLKWRFTEPKYAVLPSGHLEQLHPLSVPAAHRLHRFLNDVGLHDGLPFQPGFFHHVESTKIDKSHGNDAEESRIQKWLYHCALPFDQPVLLAWGPELALQTTWKMLLKYWSDFHYPMSDDLTVCDVSMQWALLFHHEEWIFFGTNRPRMTPDVERGAKNTLFPSH